VKKQVLAAAVAAAALFHAVPKACAADQAVIIQGWLPTEAAGLDWTPPNQDTLDELWNDCYLAFEMWCARPGIDTSPDRIPHAVGNRRRLLPERPEV